MKTMSTTQAATFFVIFILAICLAPNLHSQEFSPMDKEPVFTTLADYEVSNREFVERTQSSFASVSMKPSPKIISSSMVNMQINMLDIENEIEIEEWMLHPFETAMTINSSDINNLDTNREEEMQIESWMSDLSTWK